MITMLEWVSYLRSDVTWIKGPDSNGNYSWDDTLLDQQEIIDRVALYTTESTLPASVPSSVTPRQIRLALVSSGVSLSTIDAGIEALTEPTKSAAQISWEYATEIERDNALLAALAPSLGFTEQDLDDLFILAATL